MRLRTLGKIISAGFFVTVLAACGGGGSNSGCAAGNPDCNTGQLGATINALGVDGPLLDAAVDVFALQDYLDNGTGAASLLAVATRSNATTGLINNLELTNGAGVGPFVLVVTADVATTDLTTGAAPVLGSVTTIITAAEYARTPQPRFYATPLTSLVLSQAIANAATNTEAGVEAALAEAQADVKTLFGFGIDQNIDLLTTPPVIDDSASGDLARQAEIVEYRAAIETLTAVIAGLTSNNPADGNAILANIATDIEDGIFSDTAGDGVLALLEVVNAATPGDVLALLSQEATDLGLGVDLDPSVTLPPSYPTAPDSDQDGVPNDIDDNDTDVCLPSSFNANCAQDTDGDGDTDFTETETADTDGDGTPDYQDSSILDSDNDGLVDQADPANNDACAPSAFNAACTQDTDGDGDTDFTETETADADGDGTPDYQESSITDTDSDGLVDQADVANNDACDPSEFNAACTQDSDGDGDTDFTETETADTDSDGTPDYLESSIVDSDGDGLMDQNDPANNDACAPSAFNAACSQDSDGDGETDFTETEAADTDGDGTPDYQESSIIDSDGDGVSDELESSVADADSDGVVDQDDIANNDACDPSAFNANCAQDTDGDGDTDFIETETADSDGDGTPDYQESSVLDADSDGVSDEDDAANNDACIPSPFNANCTQDSDGDGESDFSETEAADADSDGAPDYLESSILDADSDGVVDEDDPANNDGCIPDAMSPACGADADGDGTDDATDTDDDNDSRLDGADPDSLNSESVYHFDFFYNQLSSDGSDFKAATVGETVVQQSGGTIDVGLNAAASTALDLGTNMTGPSGDGVGNFNVRSDYQTTENALLFNGAGFAAATGTTSGTPAIVSTDTSTGTDLNDPILSFTAESFDLRSWDIYNFIGAGRVDLGTLGAPLGTLGEQAVSVLSFADGASDDADLNASYGFVELNVTYSDTEASALTSVASRVFDLAFDGSGGLTTGANSEFSAVVGLTDGTLNYDSTSVTATAYTVNPTGAVNLALDASVNGFTDSEGNLITLTVDDSGRAYGAELGSGVTAADLDGVTFDLNGLVVESSNARLTASNYDGATLAFTNSGSLIATLSGTVNESEAVFDAADTALPTVALGTDALGTLTSDAITINGNGQFTATFAASDRPGFEIEGFLTASGGLLVRIIDTLETEVTGGGGVAMTGLQSNSIGGTFVDALDINGGVTPQVCDVIAQVIGGETVFVPIDSNGDPVDSASDCALIPVPACELDANNQPVSGPPLEYCPLLLIVTDAGNVVSGYWTTTGGGTETETPFTAAARGADQTFTSIPSSDEVSVTQGVLLGTPQ